MAASPPVISDLGQAVDQIMRQLAPDGIELLFALLKDPRTSRKVRDGFGSRFANINAMLRQLREHRKSKQPGVGGDRPGLLLELCLLMLGFRGLFFESIMSGLPAHYTLILDKSGSMDRPEESADPSSESRWECASEATGFLYELLTSQGCFGAQPEVPVAAGVDLWLFSTHAAPWFDIRSLKEVQSIFDQTSPSGGTNLSDCLSQVFNRHVDVRKGQREVVLVVTDGEPNSQTLAKKTIARQVKQTTSGELQISFLQIGDDPRASAFLRALDEQFGEFMEALSCEDLCGVPFTEFLRAAMPTSGAPSIPPGTRERLHKVDAIPFEISKELEIEMFGDLVLEYAELEKERDRMAHQVHDLTNDLAVAKNRECVCALM